MIEAFETTEGTRYAFPVHSGLAFFGFYVTREAAEAARVEYVTGREE